MLPTKFVPRFRDAVMYREGGEIYVKVLTRSGGGNRETYQAQIDAIKNNHPLFVKEYDDEYDSTYAYFIFKIPTSAVTQLGCELDGFIDAQTRKEINIKKMFDKELADMNVKGTEAHARAEQMARGFQKMTAGGVGTKLADNVTVVSPDDVMRAGDTTDYSKGLRIVKSEVESDN